MATPLPPVPGVARMVVHWGTGVGDMINVLHLQKFTATAWGQDDLDDATNFVENEMEGLLNRISSSIRLVDATGVDLTSTSGVTSVATAGEVGTLAGVPMPFNSTPVISWHVARRFRGGHYRTYQPPPSQNEQVDGSNFSAAYAAAIQAAWTGIRTAIAGHALPSGTGSALCGVSYFAGYSIIGGRRVPTLRPGGPVVDIFGSVSVSPLIRSQRGRVVG